MQTSPLLENLMQQSGKLLIICDDLEQEALSTLVLNKLRGVLSVLAVKAPGYGDKRKAMLQDIAILTGGEVITSELGLELKDTTLEQLGRAKQVKVQKENTIIVDGLGDKAQIKERVNQIKKLQKQFVQSGYDSKIKKELDVLVSELETIPVYVIYTENLEVVNQKIDYVRDSLNDYFQLLFEKDTIF